MIMLDDDGDVVFVTGTVADQLFGTAVIGENQRVQVVFCGYKPCMNSDHQYKDYELYVEVL